MARSGPLLPSPPPPSRVIPPAPPHRLRMCQLRRVSFLFRDNPSPLWGDAPAIPCPAATSLLARSPCGQSEKCQIEIYGCPDRGPRVSAKSLQALIGWVAAWKDVIPPTWVRQDRGSDGHESRAGSCNVRLITVLCCVFRHSSYSFLVMNSSRAIAHTTSSPRLEHFPRIASHGCDSAECIVAIQNERRRCSGHSSQLVSHVCADKKCTVCSNDQLRIRACGCH